MSKIAIVVMLVLLSVLNVKEAGAQITLQCVKPGQELLVKPDGDTLWVINDERMRSVIETGKLYRISKEQVATLQQKCDTLSEITSQQESLIQILKDDKQYYEVQLKESREDCISAAQMAKKYRRRSRLASIGIGVGVVIGLGVGYLLFK